MRPWHRLLWTRFVTCGSVAVRGYLKNRAGRCGRYSRGVFVVSERECSRTGLAVHTIDTGDMLPVRLRPHRLPFAKRLAAEQQINEMAAVGVIELSSSLWSAPVVLAKKKDGSWRFCVDYRRLNAVMRTDSYPMPRVDDTLEQLAGRKSIENSIQMS